MGELVYVKPKRRKPKGVTATYRAKRARAEGPVKKAVREECARRDGYCRYWGDTFFDQSRWSDCDGPSEWAHLESRARTRNMRPELRHRTETSVMLCRKHHDRLDGRARPRLRVELKTGRGADGPLVWRMA